MRAYLFTAASLVVAAVSHAAQAQDVRPTINLSLEAAGNAEVRRVSYACGQNEPLEVTYVNADPNILAIVPIEGDPLLFVSAISASGARYTAGRYEWWSKGAEATLRDLTSDANAKPMLTCTEVQ